MKTRLITNGIKVSRQVYDRLAQSHRIHPDPLWCNCLIMPDGTVAHLVDLSMHMGYVKAALSWETLRNLALPAASRFGVLSASLHEPF